MHIYFSLKVIIQRYWSYGSENIRKENTTQPYLEKQLLYIMCRLSIPKTDVIVM